MSYIGKVIPLGESASPSYVKSYSTEADFQAAIDAGLVALNEPGYIIDEDAIYYNMTNDGRVTVRTYATLVDFQLAIDSGFVADGELGRLVGTDSVLGDYDVVVRNVGGYPSWDGIIPVSGLGGTWAVARDHANCTLTVDAENRPTWEVTAVDGPDRFSCWNPDVKVKSASRLTLLVDVEAASMADWDWWAATVLSGSNTAMSGDPDLGMVVQYVPSVSSLRLYVGDMVNNSLSSVVNLSTASRTTYSTRTQVAAHLDIDSIADTPTLRGRCEQAGAASTATPLFTLPSSHNGTWNDTGLVYSPGLLLSTASVKSMRFLGLGCTRPMSSALS